MICWLCKATSGGGGESCFWRSAAQIKTILIELKICSLRPLTQTNHLTTTAILSLTLSPLPSLSLVPSLHHLNCVICADSPFPHNENGCLKQSSWVAAATKNLHGRHANCTQAWTRPCYSRKHKHKHMKYVCDSLIWQLRYLGGCRVVGWLEFTLTWVRYVKL